MARSNVESLVAAARLLRPLLPEMVFVGGAITSLLVDKGAGHPRPTLDVDAIAEIRSYAEYGRFAERLRALGFTEDVRDQAPVCRWVQEQTTIDVMPTQEGVLGFSNRWYPSAMGASVLYRLPSGDEIRVVDAPHFLATKLEAFHRRGGEDVGMSHDLEDVVFVIDGRDTITDEIEEHTGPLREYLRAEFRSLLDTPAFLDALPGFLLPDDASQSRLPLLRGKLKAIAA